MKISDVQKLHQTLRLIQADLQQEFQIQTVHLGPIQVE